MKGRTFGLSVVLAILIVIVGAAVVNAQEIVFTGEACPLTIYDRVNEPVEIAAESINVLGVVDEEYAFVQYPVEDGSQVGFVSIEELAEKVPALDLTMLPAVENWINLTTGSAGAMIQKLQETLIRRGFMEGIVDGSFGPRTKASVNAFLASVGLPQDGTVNMTAWFLLMDDGTLETMTAAYPPVYTVDEKFASIVVLVSDASFLEAFLDSSWKFRYDAFDRQGMIWKMLDIEPYVDDAKAIDRISIELGLAVYLRNGEDGKLEYIPALLVHTIGAYRPYFKACSLNCDGNVVDLFTLTSGGDIQGADVTEETCLVMTEEAEEAALAMDADTSLTVRLRGANRNFDMDMSGVVEEFQEFAGLWK